MRDSDKANLSRTYPPLPANFEEDNRFEEAMDVFDTSLNSLKKEIFKDFDEQKYGIKWWDQFEELGIKRRIWISDYLYQVCSGIEKNLLDAKLHLIQFQSCVDQENNRLADVCKFNRYGQIDTILPKDDCAFDEYNRHLIDLHVAGFLRSVGSAMDCLGGAIVGVLGLPTSILKADFQIAQRELSKIKQENDEVRWSFKQFLDKTMTTSGPLNWNSWSNSYRNMIVHRARRMTMNVLTPKPVGRMVDAFGYPILRTSTILHLAQHPDLTDIEATFHSDEALVLSEPAETTLTGLFGSLKSLICSVSMELETVWKKRKANPSLIIQPRKQWPEIRQSPEESFSGYTSGKPIEFSQLTSNPKFLKRIICASLDTNNKVKWDTFD